MEKEVVIKGRRITYLEEGKGSPILIIHGWTPKAISEFSEFLHLLVSQGYRAFLLNLPGFGEMSLSFPKWGTKEYLGYILEFMEYKKLKKVFLIGHSMGGAIAIRFAAVYPERIKALILLSPGIIPANIWVQRLFTISIHGWLMTLRTIELFLIIFKNSGAFFVRLFKLKGVTTKFKDRLNRLRIRYQLIRILKHIVKTADTPSYLPEIKSPTLVIFGEKDYNFYWSAPFMGRIPNYDFRILPKAGHNFQEEKPAEAIEIITRFIKKRHSS